MIYQPTRESVESHPIPDWFNNAKFGIFIHWGLYSVPAWAPIAGELSDAVAGGDWAGWFANNPYAEWYANTVRIPGSPTQRHHEATYGRRDYTSFVADFNASTRTWNPDEWADLFARVHARYVVLTTKHHDGFTLWPSRLPNPFIANYHAARDLVGDLTTAVRHRGLTMALYYSGGLDWTFNNKVIQDIGDMQAAVPQMPEYVTYANAHWRELIERYQTAILWNDIAYPADTDLNELFADYYNAIPDGVINNRFTQQFDINSSGNIVSTVHYDFDTPEYAVFNEIRAKKWESCRGIGASFGYNRIEGPEQYQTAENLIHSLIDIVSKNGNLLLNVGPMADGAIPALQRERLEGIGQWLDVYGDAIFNTRPWQVAESRTDGGSEVRFTQKGDSLFAIVLAPPAMGTVEIKGLQCRADGLVKLLGNSAPLAWRQTDHGVAVELPRGVNTAPAFAFKITPAPAWANA